VQLRRSHGVDFAEMSGRPAAYHVQKWYWFVTLSASLEEAFREDIIDYLVDIEDEGAAGVSLFNFSLNCSRTQQRNRTSSFRVGGNAHSALSVSSSEKFECSYFWLQSVLANEGNGLPNLLFDKKEKSPSETSLTDNDECKEDEMIRLQRIIGDRLKVELPVEQDALPSKIAELLRLLELKENGRLNGHGR